jgi:hypothetical protein
MKGKFFLLNYVVHSLFQLMKEGLIVCVWEFNEGDTL